MTLDPFSGVLYEAAAVRELLEHLHPGMGYQLETKGLDGEWDVVDPEARASRSYNTSTIDPRYHTLEAVLRLAEQVDGDWRIRPRGQFDMEAFEAKLRKEGTTMEELNAKPIVVGADEELSRWSKGELVAAILIPVALIVGATLGLLLG